MRQDSKPTKKTFREQGDSKLGNREFTLSNFGVFPLAQTDCRFPADLGDMNAAGQQTY